MGQHDAGKFWPQALCWRGDLYDDDVTIDSRVFFSLYGVTDLDNRGKCCCWPSHQEAALQPRMVLQTYGHGYAMIVSKRCRDYDRNTEINQFVKGCSSMKVESIKKRSFEAVQRFRIC